MSENKTPQEGHKSLNFSKEGSWKEIIDISENIQSLLGSVTPEDVNRKITKEQFNNLSKEWKKWRPQGKEKFSKEMREKTAKQCSIGKSELEDKKEKMDEELENASSSVKKVTGDAKNGELKKLANHLATAIKCTGRAVDSKIRQNVRPIEEKIYEKIILKANSLYFDHSALNAILSKKIGGENAKKYQLTLHSNNPDLRRFLADKIEWDECW